MPEVVVEFGEDGKPVKVPAEVQALIDRSFGQGQAKATDEAAKKMKTEIESLRQAGNLNPAERERLRSLEVDLSKTREELAMRDKNFEEAQKIREERHARDLSEREDKLKAKDAEVERRTGRIRELLGNQLRAAALEAGARKESIGELEVLLGSRIGLDDALQAFVTDAKDAGKAALDKDGKPVTIEGFVAQYLTDHPHHKSPTSGRGGGGRGGRSTAGDPGVTGEKAQAFESVAANPTVASVANAFRHVGRSA
jgi:hypothetical protein